MVLNIERDVRLEALRILGGAPGLTKQPIDVSPEHRSRVIEGKDRVKSDLFELALADDTAVAPLDGCVAATWKMGFDPLGIVRVLIAHDERSGGNARSKLFEKFHCGFRPIVISFAVFF